MVGEALADDGATVHHLGLDLAEPAAPARLIDAATDAFGHLDILVCNHARSGGDGRLGTLDAAKLRRASRSP
jgi:3-oxoacyl-[acyl-carrier protein] reductase